MKTWLEFVRESMINSKKLVESFKPIKKDGGICYHSSSSETIDNFLNGDVNDDHLWIRAKNDISILSSSKAKQIISDTKKMLKWALKNLTGINRTCKFLFEFGSTDGKPENGDTISFNKKVSHWSNNDYADYRILFNFNQKVGWDGDKHLWVATVGLRKNNEKKFELYPSLEYMKKGGII